MVNIALSTDQNLLPYLKVVVNSLLEHTSEEVMFNIFTRGITRLDLSLNMSIDCAFTHIQMDNYDFGKVKLAKWVTLSTMDRIFMPSILHDIHKIVYIDIDCVVMDDIKKLYDLPTGECGIAAKQSTRVGYMTNIAYAQRTLIDYNKLKNIAGKAPNFNAGVMVMDLDKLRDGGMQEFCLSLVKSTGCNDQIAISSYSKGRFERLPARWNTWVGVDHGKIKDPGILHYVGSRKPWETVTPLIEHWNRYANQ